MTDRQKRLVVGQQAAVPIGVDTAGVGDVIAVALKKANHRILVGEDEVASLRHVATGRERTVVADLVCASDRPRVETRSTEGVVRLPGGVRRLVQHVRVARVISYDENDVIVRVSVGTGQLGHVNTGNRAAGHRPGCRLRPVAAVGEVGGGVEEAGGLALYAAVVDGGHLPGSVTPVPTKAIDVDPVGTGTRFDLEMHRAAGVHADVGAEALNGVVTGAGGVPLRLR